MRAAILLFCSLAFASTLAQKVAPLAGSWKSPDVGMGDFPMWMIDIYHPDVRVTPKFMRSQATAHSMTPAKLCIVFGDSRAIPS
jgi:hypothetical protein